MNFDSLIDKITEIGVNWHGESILDNSRNNLPFINKSIKELPDPVGEKKGSAIVISAGPSLHYNDTLKKISQANYEGSIISIDGSYVKCLKAGLIPDYVLTLDPHPTRMVRWFGDPLFEKNMEGDDYFSRQDLDIDFRENSIRQNNENIELVNKYASKTRLIIASTSPANMVARAIEAGFDMFWWMPLVDDPTKQYSLTKKMHAITKLPALNTGGNVGTAAWVFAQFWLNVPRVSVVGMDLGYKQDTPYEMTQTYPELVDMLGKENVTSSIFPEHVYPQTGEVYYSDPTYTWYKNNILDLIKNSGVVLNNCTEGGTFYGEGVNCISLEEFLESVKYG